MAEYLLSLWQDDDHDVPNVDEMRRVVAQVEEFNAELISAGSWVYGNGLDSPAAATVVRAEGGEVSLTEGPFARSKDRMGGFWVIDAADSSAALEWAGKAAQASERPVELRPFERGES